MAYTYYEYFTEMDLYKSSIANPSKGGKQAIVLSPNALQFRQKINDIGAVDLTDKKFWTPKNGTFLKIAVYFNIHLFKQDIDYFNEKVCSNPIFDLISPQLGSTSLMLTGFYEKILQDKKIPYGAKKVISIEIAHSNGYKTSETLRLENYRRPYIDLWLEIVSLTRQ